MGVALVALVGPSAAGKTTLARELVRRTGIRVVTLVKAALCALAPRAKFSRRVPALFRITTICLPNTVQLSSSTRYRGRIVFQRRSQGEASTT